MVKNGGLVAAAQPRFFVTCKRLAYDVVLMKGEDCERESEETLRDVLFDNPPVGPMRFAAPGQEKQLRRCFQFLVLFQAVFEVSAASASS
jgi:hypothetical protein